MSHPGLRSGTAAAGLQVRHLQLLKPPRHEGAPHERRALFTAVQTPTLADDLRITPFHEPARRDRFLVSARSDFYVVSPLVHAMLRAVQAHRGNAMDRCVDELAATHGVTRDDVERALESLPRSFFEAGRATRDEPADRLFLAHRTLLPERIVARLAARFAPLVSVPVAVVACIVAIPSTLALLGGRHGVPTLAELAAIYAAVYAGCVFHEIGHASAVHRFGETPGRIGVGVYLILPAFFTDVSRAWSLTVTQRAVVDLGGVYFQTLLLAISSPIALLTHDRVAVYFSLTTVLLIVNTLNPFLKYDGYWFLSDVTGLTNLHGRMRNVTREWAALDRWRKIMLSAYIACLAVWAAFALVALAKYLGYLGWYFSEFARQALLLLDVAADERAQALAQLVRTQQVQPWIALLIAGLLVFRVLNARKRRRAGS